VPFSNINDLFHHDNGTDSSFAYAIEERLNKETYCPLYTYTWFALLALQSLIQPNIKLKNFSIRP